MAYDLGDAVELEASVDDSDGVSTTATTATLTITLPDGTTASPEVDEPTEPGTYRVSYTPTQAGLHSVRWVFTTPDRAFTDVFSVRPAIAGQIMSIADAKTHLNKSKSSTVNDEELRLMIIGATAIVEREIGPVVRRTHVETHRGGRAIALSRRQVLEVTAVEYVSDGSTAVDVADVRVDGESGVLWTVNGHLPDAPLRVTYVVGRPIVDDAIILAAGIIVDHLWKTQRGHSARPGLFGQQVEQPTNEEQALAYYAGFALPNRAAELLAGYADVAGGIA